VVIGFLLTVQSRQLSTSVHGADSGALRVEEVDRVLAAVTGEVPVQSHTLTVAAH
jgi:hypothetical protein